MRLVNVGLGIAVFAGMVLCLVGFLMTLAGAVLLGIDLVAYWNYLQGGSLFMAASPLYFWILVGGVCTLLAGIGLLAIYNAVVHPR